MAVLQHSYDLGKIVYLLSRIEMLACICVGTASGSDLVSELTGDKPMPPIFEFNPEPNPTLREDDP